MVFYEKYILSNNIQNGYINFWEFQVKTAVFGVQVSNLSNLIRRIDDFEWEYVIVCKKGFVVKYFKKIFLQYFYAYFPREHFGLLYGVCLLPTALAQIRVRIYGPYDMVDQMLWPRKFDYLNLDVTYYYKLFWTLCQMTIDPLYGVILGKEHMDFVPVTGP